MSLKFPSFGFKESPGNYVAAVWEQSGTTPVGGQPWCMKTTHQRDYEDNDTSYSMTLGPLSFYHSSDCGRDWASIHSTVTYKDPATGKEFKASNTSEAGRSGEKSNSKDVADRDQVIAGINAVAAKEGMTGKQLAVCLPSYFTALVGSLASS